MKLFSSKKFTSKKNIEQKDKFKKIMENKEKSVEMKNEITNINNHKQLICDDSDVNRLILKKYLSIKNVMCDESTDGLNCIDQVKKFGIYDIIWMDIQMPKMNGFECTKTLRNEYNYNGIIIGLTGYTDQTSINNALTFGMNHVIGKPINKENLYAFVDKYGGSLAEFQ